MRPKLMDRSQHLDLEPFGVGTFEVLRQALFVRFLGVGANHYRSEKRRQGNGENSGAKPAVNLLPKPLISSPFREGPASFSPDGRKVVFSWAGEKGDSPGIYVKQIGAAAPPLRAYGTL